jgi:hypothetical protein
LIISGKKYPERTGFDGFSYLDFTLTQDVHNGTSLPASLRTPLFKIFPSSHSGILLSPYHPKPRLRKWLHSNVPGVGNAAPVLGILSKLSVSSIIGIITAGTE